MICDSSSIPRFQQSWLPVCEAAGAHFCQPRALFAQAFFEHALVHTKGRHARRAFILAPWQRDEIIHPLFGQVHFNDELGIYVRDYRTGWIELARKNGKSELLAGVALYMLTQDGEEGAEIYGAAKDRDQARIIWNVAHRMVQLSPVLSRRAGLRIRRHEKRIVDEITGSFYGILARDAMGNLGLDPTTRPTIVGTTHLGRGGFTGAGITVDSMYGSGLPGTIGTVMLPSVTDSPPHRRRPIGRIRPPGVSADPGPARRDRADVPAQTGSRCCGSRRRGGGRRVRPGSRTTPTTATRCHS